MKTIALTIKDEFWEMIKNKEKVIEFRKKSPKFDGISEKDYFNILFRNEKGKALGVIKANFKIRKIHSLVLDILTPNFANDINKNCKIRDQQIEFLFNEKDGYFKDYKVNDEYVSIFLSLSERSIY